MPQPPSPPAEVLVLRAWAERHDEPLRVRVVRFLDSEERVSTVVYRQEEALAIVAEWLRDWSAYAQAHPRNGG